MTAVAVRLWEPLTVAFAESVAVEVALSMVWIVVPDGMPLPVTVSPTKSPVVLLGFVIDADPFVSVPVKAVELTVWIVVPDGMPVPVTVCPATRPNGLLMPVTDADPLVSVPVNVNVPAVVPLTVRLVEIARVTVGEVVGGG